MRILMAFILAALVVPSAVAEEVRFGEFQLGFLQVIGEYAKKYEAADNELKKSALVKQRVDAWKKLKGDPRKIKDWYGEIDDMGTTSDGHAYLVVKMGSNDVVLKTWNNAFSDASDKTLIKQSSPLFGKLAEMEEGNVIKFSGRLKQLTNFTEAGKMTEPEFLFKFTSVEKVFDHAAK